MLRNGKRRSAVNVRLFEHPDFEQAIVRATEHFRAQGLRPAIIEKDYYVTEALRVIADTAGDKVIFKGGTSLSKGWNLIQRFSEDIDLFLDPLAFTPNLGKKAIDRELKRLRDSITKHPALKFIAEESMTIGGFGRSDRFAYAQKFGGPGEVANRVLLESGTASVPTQQLFSARHRPAAEVFRRLDWPVLSALLRPLRSRARPRPDQTPSERLLIFPQVAERRKTTAAPLPAG